MGLGDIYDGNMANRIVQGGGSNLQRGFESAPELNSRRLQDVAQNQANVDAAYNSPARPATHHEAAIADYVRKMMDGPPEYVDRLKQELRGGGMGGGSNTQNGPSEPPPQSPGLATDPTQWMGTMNAPRGPMGGQPMQQSQAPIPTPSMASQNFATDIPRNERTASAGLSPMDTNPTGMWMGRPGPATGLGNGPAYAQAPVNKLPPRENPMSRGDVNEYMRMAPLISAEAKLKPKSGGRDYLAEIAARGEEARKTEGTKQTGRVDIDELKGTRAKLMKAAELALKSKQLDETTSRHIDQFNVDLAKLENMAKFQDRLLDMKGGAQQDQMMRDMKDILTRMSNSKAQLISSGFASTPLGQEFLQEADSALQGPARILVEYEDGKRQVRGGGQTTVKKEAVTQQGTNRPPPPTIAPRNQTPRAVGTPSKTTYRVRLKIDIPGVGKKGEVFENNNPSEFDPATMEKL